MLPESGGRRVEVHGKALPEPENARLMRKAAEKKRKTKVSEVAKRAERRKKSNGEPECPLIRGKQQRGEGKQRALGKEKAAATRLERGKRKREREVATRKPWGERLKCGGKGGVIHGSFALEFGRERKAMVRNGRARDEGLTSRGVA